MKILTNNRRRPLVCAADLPVEVQECFDYLKWEEGYDPRFVKYRGHWYDVYDSMLWHGDRKEWDSHLGDTYFSGALFRLVGDHEVIVGRYYA